MQLYKYKCSTCGKIWYEEDVSSSVHHGCPDGCDDAGEYIERGTFAETTLPEGYDVKTL